MAAMTATRLWARKELGQRWRALVVLGLIAGVAAGLALGAVAQARRSATVYSRYRAATNAPDAIVFGTQVEYDEAIDYAPVIALPEVLDAGKFNLAPVGIKGYDDMGSLPTDDAHLYRTLAKPLLRAGRLARPGREDEIVINELAAKRHHLDIGDRVTIVTSNDLEAFFSGKGFVGGPRIPATVVGIGNTPLDYIFTIDEPGSYPSGTVLSRHPEIPRFPNLVVRLEPGTDVNAFHLRAAKALNLPDVPVRDLGQERKRFTHGTDLERTALLLFAAAVVLAGLVLAGQALARSVYAMAAQSQTLSALGLTRRQLVVGLVLPTLLTAVVAAAVAVGLAVALSERFHVGLSRELEPDLGTHADWPVLLGGATAVVLLVIGGAAIAGLRATSARRAALVGRGFGVLAAIRSVAPLPVALGASLALEPGRGERSTPVRPALAGTIAGILGIVGALGLVRGIDESLRSPRRAGQVFDAFVYADEEHSTQQNIAAVRPEPLVQGVSVMNRLPMNVNGEGIPVYALRPVKGNVGFVVLDGRAPVGSDEVALAPASMRALGKHIGDRLAVGGVRLRVVGTALLPQTAHSSFDQGAWVSPRGLARLPESEDNGTGEEVAIAVKPGVSVEEVGKKLEPRLEGAEVDSPSIPQDVLLLRNVRTLPRVLAAFLGLLGVAALGHALVTAVRRRRNDLAVLRALGFRPMQNAMTIVWQATTVALIGLVVGLPLGIAAGRLSWQWVADSTPLLYVAPIAGLAVALSIPGTLAIANGLAALPARRAARLRAVDVLRTE